MKRKEPLKVPRASLAVTLLSDPEWIELLQSPEGRDAALLFVCLILAAKEQNNAGRFEQASAVVAMLVRWPLPEFKSALEYLLKMPGRWVVAEQGAIVLRGFTKWNAGWGGAREGAGRPAATESKTNSRRNQVKPTPPLPVSVPVVPSELPPPNPPEVVAVELEEFMQEHCGRTPSAGQLQELIGVHGLAAVTAEAESRAAAGEAAFAGIGSPERAFARRVEAGPPAQTGAFGRWRGKRQSRSTARDVRGEAEAWAAELRNEAAQEGAA